MLVKIQVNILEFGFKTIQRTRFLYIDKNRIINTAKVYIANDLSKLKRDMSIDYLNALRLKVKGFGERVSSILIQFDIKGMLSARKSRVSYK